MVTRSLTSPNQISRSLRVSNPGTRLSAFPEHFRSLARETVSRGCAIFSTTLLLQPDVRDKKLFPEQLFSRLLGFSCPKDGCSDCPCPEYDKTSYSTRKGRSRSSSSQGAHRLMISPSGSINGAMGHRFPRTRFTVSQQHVLSRESPIDMSDLLLLRLYGDTGGFTVCW